MGVVYKLQPEIRDFILEKKKAEPGIGCRQLAVLILDKFKIEISKSSVNAIIKSAGLSMPVGRRQKKKRRSLGSMGFPLEIKPGTPLAVIPEKPVEIPVEEPTLPPVEEKPPIAPLIVLPEEPEIKPAPKEPTVPAVKEPAEVVVEQPMEKVIEPEKEEPPKETEETPVKEVPAEKPPEPPAEEAILAPVDKSVEKLITTPSFEIYTETLSEQPCTGAILLKAAECLIGGSQHVTALIKNRLARRDEDILSLTESLIYLPLFEKGIANKEIEDLWALIDRKIPLDSILRYLNELQVVNTLLPKISETVSKACQDIRCLKAILSDGNAFYLDGQLYSVWSSPHVPYDFATTIYKIKSYLNVYFGRNLPFILGMAPGYDTPSKEYFDFMSSLETIDNNIEQIVLYGNSFEEIETILTPKNQKHFFIFGLWPWQFTMYRKVNSVGEFRKFTFEALKEEYYIADIEIELLQPKTQQAVTLRGCTLKKSLNEKIKLIVLSNLSVEQAKSEELVNTYFNHWPNLEETFQDFSRKIELFTYTAASQRFFSTQSLGSSEEATQDLKKIFSYYLRALDLYVKWHFLPSGYEDKDFPTIKENFYDLKAQITTQKEQILVTFQPPAGYAFLKDLQYACRRVNEREVISPESKRLWLSVCTP
jgi:hypothetical protein